MSAAGPYLRKTQRGYLHWCPGCDHAHAIAVGQPERPSWDFDGNLEQPTFNPSIHIFTPADPEDGMPAETICHYFIRAGQIQFCGDSGYALAGVTVPLPIFPAGEAS